VGVGGKKPWEKGNKCRVDVLSLKTQMQQLTSSANTLFAQVVSEGGAERGPRRARGGEKKINSHFGVGLKTVL